jgi:hypothetical protein
MTLLTLTEPFISSNDGTYDRESGEDTVSTLAVSRRNRRRPDA